MERNKKEKTRRNRREGGGNRFNLGRGRGLGGSCGLCDAEKKKEEVYSSTTRKGEKRSKTTRIRCKEPRGEKKKTLPSRYTQKRKPRESALYIGNHEEERPSGHLANVADDGRGVVSKRKGEGEISHPF